ncbi:MAG TPA: hypothetical protein VGM37_15390 [Armatimonadota bacterium]|jgi:hypothetical protein
MKIASATVQLAAQHEYVRASEHQESLRAWAAAPAATAPKDTVSISAEAHRLNAEAKSGDNASTLPKGLRLARLILERLTGRRIHGASDDGGTADTPEMPAATAAAAKAAAPASQGWGFEYHSVDTTHEAETTAFAAQGVATTEDGRQIAFQVNLNMQRESTTEARVDIRAGDALSDPLVINFTGTAAQLSAGDFSFDLNSDGAAEAMPFVGPGSGFLALDRNGDGAVNNGGELFGPATGSGMGELAQLDGDGNGWIDENDAAFSALRIWSKDESGADTLSTLKDRNVGAIYLGSVATPFSVPSSAGDTRAQIRDTGIYLSESGQPGTIQELDVATA